MHCDMIRLVFARIWDVHRRAISIGTVDQGPKLRNATDRTSTTRRPCLQPRHIIRIHMSSTSISSVPPLAEDHKLLGRVWELPYSTESTGWIHSAADLKSAYHKQDANFAYVVTEVLLEEINLYNRLENIRGWGFAYSDRMVRVLGGCR
jgi:hypothetical protein